MAVLGATGRCPRYVHGIAKVGPSGAAEVRDTHRTFVAFAVSGIGRRMGADQPEPVAFQRAAQSIGSWRSIVPL